jgi:ubiquinone/menaquinone biosynthesis C-methylase UbiE
MLKRVLEHARQGTLLDAVARRIRPGQVRKNYGPDTYHGDRARSYVETRSNDKKWQIEQDIIRELLKDIPNGARVLDVPLGTGRFVESYLEKDMAVHGLDISVDMVEAARRQLGDAFDRCSIQIGSADCLPYEDGRFDLIVCCRFLGLVPLEMAKIVLSEIHRVSCGKTILYMHVKHDTFGFEYLLERIKRLSPSKRRRKIGGNIHERDFVSMIETAGFSVERRLVIEDMPKSTYLFYLLDKQSARH